MKYFRSLVITLICFNLLFFITGSNAQNHVNGWLRGSAKIRVNKKLVTEAEFQLRRQEDNANHQMEYPLMYSARTYLHYDVNDKLRISLSPFAWFEHFQLSTDGYISKTYEYRFTVAATRTDDISRNVKLFTRPAVECRIFSGNNFQVRPRLQAGIRWQVVKWLAIKPYEELMATYSLDKSVWQYDQNRLGAGLLVSAAKRAEIELGYIHITRSSTHDENILLNFYYNMGK